MYFETKEWRVGRTTIFARSPTLSRASKSGEPPVSIRNMVCTASPVNMQQTMPAHETRILASGRSSCKNLLRKVLSKFRWKPYKPGVYLTPPDGVDEMATVIADQAIAAFGGDPETVDRPALRTRLSNTNRAHASERILYGFADSPQPARSRSADKTRSCIASRPPLPWAPRIPTVRPRLPFRRPDFSLWLATTC